MVDRPRYGKTSNLEQAQLMVELGLAASLEEVYTPVTTEMTAQKERYDAERAARTEPIRELIETREKIN